MRKADLAYLQHILDGIDRVTGYLAGVSIEEFRNSHLLQAAAARELEIVGEAANKVSEETRREHPEIPWASMIATRNRLIHAYFDIDVTLVWSTVRNDLPPLREQIRRIVENHTGQLELPTGHA